MIIVGIALLYIGYALIYWGYHHFSPDGKRFGLFQTLGFTGIAPNPQVTLTPPQG